MTEDDAARGTFEWGEDGENDKVAGRSWIQASSTPSVERSGLGSMLIHVMPSLWTEYALTSFRQDEEQQVVDGHRGHLRMLETTLDHPQKRIAALKVHFR